MDRHKSKAKMHKSELINAFRIGGLGFNCLVLLVHICIHGRKENLNVFFPIHVRIHLIHVRLHCMCMCVCVCRGGGVA